MRNGLARMRPPSCAPAQCAPARVARIRSTCLIALALLTPLTAPGCSSSPKAKRLTLLLAGREHLERAASLGPFSPETSVVLANEGLARRVETDLEGLIAELETRNAADPTIERTLALSELHYRVGLRNSTLDRARAAYSLRDSAALAYLALADPILPLRAPADDELARDRYNAAVDKLIRLTWWDSAMPGHAWAEVLTNAHIDIKGRSLYLEPARLVDLAVASDFRVMNLQHRYVRDGLGVPLVAHRQRPLDSGANDEEGFYPQEVWTSATALLHVGGGLGGNTWREYRPLLMLHDPYHEQSVMIGDRAARLAADRSTALAVFDTRVNFTRLAKMGLLLTTFQDEGFHQGIVLLQPYQPGKIPVVFIHGLNSSYATWFQNLNHLRNDPELSQRYQFWVYLYPTGNPLITSVTQARRAIQGARETLDPTRQDRALDQMVLVGHSMGGLVTKGLISRSDSTLWDGIFTRSIDDVDAPPEMKDALEYALFFESVPEVKRAVFVAVPHRGSHIASRIIGQLTSGLIHQPDILRQLVATLKARNGPDVLQPDFRNPTFTSIANLRFEDPMLSLIERLPVDGVKYHSIIMKIGTVQHHLETDGVVPYESAHVEGAESEVIVPGTHTDVAKREVTAELKRILRLHLDQADQTWAATPREPLDVALDDVTEPASQR